MQYSTEIFSAYAQVFDDVHGHLKTSGFVDWTRNVLNSGRNARRVEELAGSLAHQDAALAGHANAFAKQKFENDLLSAQLRKAKQTGEGVAAPAPSHLGRNLAIGGATAGAAGLGGYLAGEKDKKRTRNLAFGAGAATGLAMPGVVRGLGNIARGASATGAFPELEGMGGYDASY